MVLIRYILIGLIIYLIIRPFFRHNEDDSRLSHGPDPPEGNNFEKKGVSKEIGEYVEYEEVDE